MLKQQRTRTALWEPAWKSKHGIKRQEASQWPQKASEKGQVWGLGRLGGAWKAGGWMSGNGRARRGVSRPCMAASSNYAQCSACGPGPYFKVENSGGAVEVIVLPPLSSRSLASQLSSFYASLHWASALKDGER